MGISLFFPYQNPKSKSLITYISVRAHLKANKKGKKTKKFVTNETCVEETNK